MNPNKGDLPYSPKEISSLRYMLNHYLEAHEWDDVCDVLTDLNFLQAKIRLLDSEKPLPLSAVFDLLRDFETALKILPTDHLMREQVNVMSEAVKEQRLTKNVIPEELGFLAFGNTNCPLSPSAIIVHISEVFCDYESSKHTVNILENLIERHGLKLIFVEGGWGDVSLSYLRDYGSKEKRIEVAEKYLKSGEISAEEYLDIVSDYQLILWGVEDENLYDQHYHAFMANLELKKYFAPTLASIHTCVELLKVRLWETPLAELEAKVDLHQKGQLNLAAFIDFLLNSAVSHGIDREEYPNLSHFFYLFKMEKAIDFTKVEQQRIKIINELSRKASKADNNRLVKRSQELQSGEISAYEYYLSLRKLAMSAGVDMTQHQGFSLYFDYLKKSKQIGLDKLTNELEQLIERLRIVLAVSPESQKLMAISKQLNIIEKLLDNSISPNEYQQVKTLPISGLAKDWSSFLSQQLRLYGLPSQEFALLEELEDKLPDCKRGNEIAHLRAEAMLQNILAKLKETQIQFAVLISGGYHALTLGELFVDHNIGLVSIAPKLDQPDDEQRDQKYLRVLKEKHEGTDHI